MKSYKNLAGHVGICSYDLRDNEMRVRFHSRSDLLFQKQETGESHFEEMTKLANQGFGLNHYIHENVIDKGIALD